MDATGPLHFNATINDIDFQTRMKAIERRINGTYNNVEAQTGKLESSLKGLGATLGGVFSIMAARQFVMQIVNVRGEIQQLEIAFGVMLKSKERADALMKDIVNFAATTPFSLQQVAGGTKQLLAYGFAAENMKENLSMLGDIASGVGSQIQDVIYLYGTLKSSGRVTQMDINQFAGRGIPIYEALSDTLGVATDKIRELVSAGKIGFADIEAAFESLTSVGGQFAGLMEAQSKSVTGQISNLGDAWEQMLNSMGKQTEGVMYTTISSLNTLVEYYQTVVNIIGTLVASYGAYKAAIIVTSAIERATVTERIMRGYKMVTVTRTLTAAEALHAAQVAIVTRAQALLNVTMLANPYAILTALVAGTVAALVLFREELTEAEKAQRKLNDIQVEAAKATVDQKLKAEDYIKTAKDETLATNKREDALRKFIALNPDVLKGLTLATLKTQEGTKAIREYNIEMERKAIKESTAAKLSELENKKIELSSGKVEEKMGFWERGLSRLKVGGSESFNKAEFERIRKQKIAEIDKDYKQLEDYKAKKEDEFDKSLEKNNRKVKVNTNTEAYIEDKIKSLEEERKNVDINSAQYKKYTAEIDSLQGKLQKTQGKTTAAQKASTKAAEEKLSVLQRIAEAEDDYYNKGLEKLERNNVEVKKRFAELRKEALKAGLGAGAITRIDRLEENELGSTKEDEVTSKLIKRLERQKEVYASFEQAKKEIGVKAAEDLYTKQYGKLIDTSKSFLAVAQDELAKVAIVGDNIGYTPAMRARQEALTEMVKAANKEQSDDTARLYQDLLVTYATYEEKKARVNKEYGDKYALASTEHKEEVLKEWGSELGAILDIKIKGSKAYKDLFDYAGTLSKRQLKERINNLQNELNAIETTTEAEKKARREVQEYLKKLKIDAKDNSQEMELIIQRLQSVSAEFKDIGGSIGAITSSLFQSARAYVSISKDLKKLRSDESSGLEKFSAGAGIVGAAMGVVGGIFSAINQARDRERQRRREQMQQDLQQELKEIDAVNKSLERQLQLINKIYGTEKINAYIKALDRIKERQKNINKELSGRLQLTGDKTLDEMIVAYNRGDQKIGGYWGNIDRQKALGLLLKETSTVDTSNLEELQNLIDTGKLDEKTEKLATTFLNLSKNAEDAAEAMKDAIAGSSFESIADGLIDAITQGAEQGGKNFEDIIKRSIMNSLKDEKFSKMAKEFYENLYNAASDGLTKDEIEVLRSEYESLQAYLKKRQADIEAVTGVNLNAPTDTSKTSVGTIARQITEETGSELVGVARGSFDLLKEANNQRVQSLRLASDNLAALQATERNTAATVARLDAAIVELRTISNNTASGSKRTKEDIFQ